MNLLNYLRRWFDPANVGGLPRSTGWEKESKNFIKENPLCKMGLHKSTILNPLNTHHILSFHEHPELEMQKSNWIVLCRFHHFWDGHFGSWSSSNPDILKDCEEFNQRVKNRK